jgi:hypothetical protein
MNTTLNLTPGQRFAEAYGNGAVEEMLKTIKLTKRLALFIVIAVMAVSYQHQMHYLMAIGTDTPGSLVIPLIIDAATLLCVKVLGATGMAKTAKMIALGFMLGPVGASAWINFSGSANRTVGWIYVIVVALIAVVEIIKAFIKPDFDSILAEEARIQPARKVGRKLTEAEKAERAASRERNRLIAIEEAQKEAAREQRRARREAREMAKAFETVAPISGAPASTR